MAFLTLLAFRVTFTNAGCWSTGQAGNVPYIEANVDMVCRVMAGHYPANYVWHYCIDYQPPAGTFLQNGYHWDFNARNYGDNGNYLSVTACTAVMRQINVDCPHGGSQYATTIAPGFEITLDPNQGTCAMGNQYNDENDKKRQILNIALPAENSNVSSPISIPWQG